jgi:O-antigen/teichoic acid export membrane protein
MIMETISRNSDQPASMAAKEALQTQIRGTGLLLAGRVLSVVLTALTQVLIVRCLSTHDYGAWAYALSVVLLWQTLSSFGFQEAIPRFVSLYHEGKDYPRLFGTILLAVGSIVLSGSLVIAAFFLSPDKLLALVHEEKQSLAVLSILICMVPVEALDGVLIGLFATLASPRSIFFRRHVLAPALRLAVVLLLIGLKTNVVFLAYGYLASSVLGVLVCAGILVRHMERNGLLAHFHLREICFPVRELFSFVLPMMTSDLMPIVKGAVIVLLLGRYHGLRDVALYRVVMPAANMNFVVGLTAGVLYMPLAARLLAKGDQKGLVQLYWRTAAWVAVLSFPIFVATFAFARPLTIALFGARYAEAGMILAIVSAGNFFEVMWGFNSLTLKALNKGGSVVTCNVLTAVVTCALALVLIPAYGALGAAITDAAAMVTIAILRQAALGLAVGIGLFDSKYLAFYLFIVAAAAPLLIVRSVVGSHLYLGAILAVLSMAAVLFVTRRELRIPEIFPESARIPLLARFFA